MPLKPNKREAAKIAGTRAKKKAKPAGPKTKTEITRAELSTILAGLRTWQSVRFPLHRNADPSILDVADEHGRVDVQAIDALCEQLNGADLIEVRD